MLNISPGKKIKNKQLIFFGKILYVKYATFLLKLVTGTKLSYGGPVL